MYGGPSSRAPRSGENYILAMPYPPWYMALNAGEWQRAILTDCHSSTVSLNFVWDTAPSGLRAGLNNVRSLKNAESDKIGSHLIIIFTRLSLKKKLIIFLLSKVKVKMASILCFRKRFQWYLKVCRLVKLVSKPLSGRGLSNKTSIFSLEPLEQSFLWVLSTR